MEVTVFDMGFQCFDDHFDMKCIYGWGHSCGGVFSDLYTKHVVISFAWNMHSPSKHHSPLHLSVRSLIVHGFILHAA